MDISCVILTWNSEKYISKCLESLLRDLDENQFSYEIFIVDNGSVDNTTEIINSYKDKFPQCIFPIYLKKNTGTTYSRNLALRKVEGSYIVIMDSDVVIAIWTRSIAQTVRRHLQQHHIGKHVPVDTGLLILRRIY